MYVICTLVMMMKVGTLEGHLESRSLQVAPDREGHGGHLQVHNTLK